jgi:hypothetical protein
MYIPTVINKFNDWLAVKITNGVGTMWCAYIFAAIAIYGGTTVNWSKASEVVQWISQTFLQLVLLSIIMVGQKVISKASDKQAQETHDTIMVSHQELLHLVRELHAAIEAFRKDTKERFTLMHPEMEKQFEAAEQSQ